MNYTNSTHAPPLAPEEVRTGDLGFFHGEGNFGSTIIELSGASPWSHVTLVVEYDANNAHQHQQQQEREQGQQPQQAQQYKQYQQQPSHRHYTPLGVYAPRPGLWEATSWHANQREVLHHELRSGARMVDLEERLHLVPPGSVGVRQLHVPRQERNDLSSRIQRFISAEDGKPYEPSWWPLIRSWFDVLDSVPCMQPLLGRNPRDVSAYFCSELVAETLMQANVLQYTPGRPSSEFTVADLSRLVDQDMVSPYRYGPLRPLVWSSSPT